VAVTGRWRDRRVSQAFPEIRVPWRAVAAELRAALQRDMQPGEPLPSITDLCARYGVSRKTAQRALAAVAGEGLAELRVGVGYFAVPARPAKADGEPG
jgi:DNA-binding GntR family transcriptional regulator